MYNLKNLKYRFPNLLIRKLDKNMGTVIIWLPIWNKSVYASFNESNHFIHIQPQNKQLFLNSIYTSAYKDFDDITFNFKDILINRKKAKERLQNEYKNIGSFMGLLKLHKGQKPNGLWPIRCVIRHSHSIIKSLSIANGILWRKLRYKIEIKSNFETVLDDVTDLIYDLKNVNNDIKNNKINLNKIKIIVADMEKMYPSTKRDKTFYNLHIGEAIAKLTSIETEFIRAAHLYINKYSYFNVGDNIYHQPNGFIIGSNDGGDGCDTVYYIDEYINKNYIQETTLYFKRYRDDIIFIIYDISNTFDENTALHF
eukprot:180554_1